MKATTKRRLVILSFLAVVFLLVAEILLRSFWGFGDMVLFFEHPEFEYLPVPNQDRHRFGNRIFYNEYSMRSLPINASDSCVVLGFGDSVINGGTLTDQDSLATTMVENKFNGRMRFLNISAGSWGPDNCAAYLKEHGDFDAKMIVLFVSSHDAHDNMMHEKVVGVDEAYPDRQYPLAGLEVLDKYLIPRVNKLIFGSSEGDNLMINKNGKGFNSGFQDLANHANFKEIPMLVCLHAERNEVEAKAFNLQGEEIINFCRNNNIKVITGLEIGEKLDFYRDDIHLNELGQKAWASVLETEIRSNLRSCLN